MGKITAALLSLSFLLCLSMPATAEDDEGDMDAPAAMASMHDMQCAPGRHCDGPGATYPRMRRSCRTPDFYLRMSDELGLSDSQVEALDGLDAGLRKEVFLKGASVKVMEMDLSDMVGRVDFRLDDALARLKDIEKARTELRTAVLTASSKARDVLTPEQKAQLKAVVIRQPADGDKRTMMKQMRHEMMRENMP